MACKRNRTDRPPASLENADPELVAAIKDYAAAPREERRITPEEVLEDLRVARRWVAAGRAATVEEALPRIRESQAALEKMTRLTEEMGLYDEDEGRES